MLSRRTVLASLAAIPLAPGAAAAGGKGKGGGNNGNAGGKGKGAANNSPPDNAAPTAQPTAPAENLTPPGMPAGGTYRVRHRNGFQETLAEGRYRMTDGRGRLIVDRPAKPEDYSRIRSLAR